MDLFVFCLQFGAICVIIKEVVTDKEARYLTYKKLENMKNKIIYCIGGIVCFLAMFIPAHAEDHTPLSALEVRISRDMAALETRLAKETAASESRLSQQMVELNMELRTELKTELSEIKNSLPSAWAFYLTVWGAAFSIVITLVITIIITGRRGFAAY